MHGLVISWPKMRDPPELRSLNWKQPAGTKPVKREPSEGKAIVKNIGLNIWQERLEEDQKVQPCHKI